MKNMNRTLKATVALGLCLIFLSVTALKAADRSPYSANLYFLYNGWKTDVPNVGNLKVNQSVFGLNAALRPSDRFSLQIDGKLSGNSASGAANFGGFQGSGKASFSSLNDTRVKATMNSQNNTTSISAYLGLPTGKTDLSLEQFAIVTVLSDASRKYVVRRVGQGLDVGGEALIHPHFGEVTVTGGGAFYYRGAYRARAIDTKDYKYGNEIHGIAGLAYKGRKVDADGNVTVIYYFKDKYGDAEIYQAGLTQLYQFSVQYTEMFNLYAGANVLIRGAAKLPAGPGSSTFSQEQLNSGRNEMLLYAGGSYPVAPKLSVLGQLEYKKMSKNKYPETSPIFRPGSHYVGISAGAGYRLTRIVGASGMLSYYTGTVNGQAGIIPDGSLSGFGATLVLTVRAE